MQSYELYGAASGVNQACAAGTTPLWQACSRGHFQHLQPLIAKGADVNAVNKTDFRRHSDSSSTDIVVKRGSTPLELVVRYHARRSGFEEAQALLLQAGARLRVRLWQLRSRVDPFDELISARPRWQTYKSNKETYTLST